jgi:hypothetical protein
LAYADSAPFVEALLNQLAALLERGIRLLRRRSA